MSLAYKRSATATPVLCLLFLIVGTAHAQVDAGTKAAPPVLDAQTGADAKFEFELFAAPPAEDAARSDTDAGSDGQAQPAEAGTGSVLSPTEELAKFDNTELLKYGVTGGFALAIQTQLSHRKLGGKYVDPRVSFAAIGYVQVNPGYWFATQANREACSTQWSRGDEAIANTAAHAVAVENAKLVLESIVAFWRVVPTGTDTLSASVFIARSLKLPWKWDDDENEDEIAKYKKLNGIILETIASARALVDPATPDPQALRNNLVQALAYTEWNPSLRAKCFWKRFPGIWGGYAFDYDTPNSQSSSTRTKNGFAFGIAYSPFAQVSAMLGLTRATLDRPDYRDLPVWAFTAALGGNLDIITSVGKLLLK